MGLLEGILLALSIILGLLAAWLWSQWSRAKALIASERAPLEEARARADAQIAEARAEITALRERAGRLEADAATLREQLEGANRLHAQRMESQVAVLTAERRAIEQQKDALEKRISELNEQTAERFRTLAGDALKAERNEFMKLVDERRKADRQTAEAEIEQRRAAVEQLVKPIRETLTKADEKLVQLSERIEGSTNTTASLRDETARLSRALSRPEIRGRYGEIQLRRVAELAGMRGYCDFDEQASMRDSDGNLLRPDMIVRLPNERVIAVDAKTNIDAYIQAVNAPDESEREGHLDRFARHVADQASSLAAKRYWQWEGSAEFVVMFVPGDHFIDAALQRRPEIIESAAQQGVILASPATLIGLLRAVAVGWRENKLAEDARELLALGAELHERTAVALEHASNLGRALSQAVDRYNRLAGSLDSRLLPTLRKFEEAGVKSAKTLAETKAISDAVSTRLLEASEEVREEAEPSDRG